MPEGYFEENNKSFADYLDCFEVLGLAQINEDLAPGIKLPDLWLNDFESLNLVNPKNKCYEG